MQEQTGTRKVFEKLDPQPGTRRGTLDDTRNIGDDETALAAGTNDTEIRMQRRKRIIGDLRSGTRHRGDQTGLAGIRQAKQADIGKQYQLQVQRAPITGRARG